MLNYTETIMYTLSCYNIEKTFIVTERQRQKVNQYYNARSLGYSVTIFKYYNKLVTVYHISLTDV